jgi:hypothetical protein
MDAPPAPPPPPLTPEEALRRLVARIGGAELDEDLEDVELELRRVQV